MAEKDSYAQDLVEGMRSKGQHHLKDQVRSCYAQAATDYNSPAAKVLDYKQALAERDEMCEQLVQGLRKESEVVESLRAKVALSTGIDNRWFLSFLCSL